MAQILGVKQAVQPWGTILGTALGEGISHLAQAKIAKMREDQNVQRFTSVGIDPVSARFIATLPPDRQIEAASTYLQQAPQQQQQQQSVLGSLQQQPQINAQPQENLSAMLSAPQAQPEQVMQQQMQPALQQQPQVQLQQAQQLQAQQPQEQFPQAPQQGTALGKALATPAQRAAERKEQFEREKAAKKEKSEANKATQKYYDEVINAEKAAKESDTDLKKMNKLIEKGKLPPATLYKSLKDAEESLSSFGGAAKSIGAGAALGFATGGPIGAAVGAGAGLVVSPVATMALYGVRNAYPDTEEFEKLSNGFIKYAKSIFGARITDQDLKAFLATVPTLANTEHGKKAIIHNMDLFNKAVHAKYDVMREIIKENNGNRPLDLALQVQDRLDAELDRLADEFEESTGSAESSALLKRV